MPIPQRPRIIDLSFPNLKNAPVGTDILDPILLDRIVKIHFIFPTSGGKLLAGEPWMDNDQDDVHDPEEPFFDVDGDGRWSPNLSKADATKLTKLFERRLNELFAQACIRFAVSGPTFQEVPAALASGNLVLTDGSASGLAALQPDEQAVFNAGMNSGTDNDLEVYFWKRIRKTGFAVGGLSGRAYPSDSYPNMPNTGDLNDTVFINTASGYFTLGHEIGHILRQKTSHAPVATPHLLFSDFLSPILKEEEVKPIHSKRLLKEWVDEIRQTKGPHNSAEYAEAP